MRLGSYSDSPNRIQVDLTAHRYKGDNDVIERETPFGVDFKRAMPVSHEYSFEYTHKRCLVFL